MPHLTMLESSLDLDYVSMFSLLCLIPVMCATPTISLQNSHDLARCSYIFREVQLDKNQVRTKLLRNIAGHSRSLRKNEVE